MDNQQVQWLLALGGDYRYPFEQEAVEIKKGLIACGVNRACILMDTESYSTDENAKAARLLIRLAEKQEWRKKKFRVRHLLPNARTIKKVVVVANQFHIRRAVMTDKRWLSGKENINRFEQEYEFEYYPYPYDIPNSANESASTLEESSTALSNDDLIATVEEYFKIYDYRDDGDLCNIEEPTIYGGSYK